MIMAKKLDDFFKQRVYLLRCTHILLTFLKPIAFTANIDDIAVMEYTVQNCGRNRHVRKDLVPLRKRLIR